MRKAKQREADRQWRAAVLKAARADVNGLAAPKRTPENVIHAAQLYLSFIDGPRRGTR